MKFLFLLFIFLYCADTYKVLVFNPAFGASHSNFLGKLSDILIDAGHDVTMLIPVSLQGKKNLVGSKKVKKIIKIDQDPRSIEMNKATNSEDVMKKQIWTAESDLVLFLQMADSFSTSCSYQCEYIFQDAEIFKNLREENFDLGITESLFICGYPIFDHIGVKTVINADSTLFMDAVKNAIGEPAATTFYPGIFSPLTDKLNMIERVENTMRMYLSIYFSKMRFEKELEIIKPYYNGTKSWREHIQTAAFNMVNSNRFLDFASVALPKTVFVGGMQVNTKKSGKVQLAKEWDELLSERKTNVLVSFGSNAYSSDMPDEFKQAFLEVFQSMPDTTFIWKYEVENATIADHLPNVKLTTWMPQNDLLSDYRLNLFVTHGGLGSSIELAYQGKPAVVIPLMADQPRNARMIVRHGGAIKLEKTQLNDPKAISNAITTVLLDDSYRKNAEKLARLLEEQPYDPKEVVLRHCDFAVQFGSLASLDSEGRHLNTFVFYSYDLLLFALSIGFIIIVLAFYSIKICSRCVKQKVKSE